ncbi:MAG TPA: hypothetical protein VKD70_07635 [Candidatus Acidoferrum sp.]|nr:hypothetical protein [Candidatus Acidoferrum sp.]
MEQPRAKPTKTNAFRRSRRLLLVVHVIVSGKNPAGSRFSEEAFIEAVNALGALIVMKQIVSVGTHLRLKNKKTAEEIDCTAVDLGDRVDQKSAVGVEFDESFPFFWRVSFPSENWSSVPRPILPATK